MMGLLFVSPWRASQTQLSAAFRLIHTISLMKPVVEPSPALISEPFDNFVLKQRAGGERTPTNPAHFFISFY